MLIGGVLASGRFGYILFLPQAISLIVFVYTLFSRPLSRPFVYMSRGQHLKDVRRMPLSLLALVSIATYLRKQAERLTVVLRVWPPKKPAYI